MTNDVLRRHFIKMARARPSMLAKTFQLLLALRDATMRLMLSWLQRDLLPDAVIRRLIRMFIASRLRYSYQPSCHLQLSQLLNFVHSLKQVPITLRTGPHPEHDPYALPTSFFKLILGKNLKLSCCYFADERSSLEDAEKAMLEIYCERAQIKDGQSILDIGCGWGSLCLYIAQKYNNCRVTGITDSASQKAYIDELCWDLELQNLEIIAADVCTFEMDASYDRLISVETFEHIKNYKDLLKKISGWMKPDSLLFVHHVCHKSFAYHFEDVNEDDWITKYDWVCRDVLVGGTMLSANLLLYFQDDVSVVNHWLVNGKHNAQTGNEWLKRMDQNISSIKPIMESTYGSDSAVKWTVYWRTFFIFITELFGYNNGEEWMVAHLLFEKKTIELRQSSGKFKNCQDYSIS